MESSSTAVFALTAALVAWFDRVILSMLLRWTNASLDYAVGPRAIPINPSPAVPQVLPPGGHASVA
jgi:hypothetical protein